MLYQTLKTALKDALCVVLRLVQSALGVQTPAITVLGYHAVSDDQTLVDVTPDAFVEQIIYMLSRGYQFVSLKKALNLLEEGHRPKRPLAVLTFDDGYEDLIKNVAPTLDILNIPATYFVLSQPEKVDRAYINNDKKLITRNNIQALLNFAGADIQAHTTSHSDLTVNSVNFIKNDIRHSIKTLETSSDQPVTYFAYPWGKYNQDYVTALEEAGISAAFTTEAGFLSLKQNPYLYPRIMVDHTHSIHQFKFMLTPLYPWIYRLLAFIYKTRTLRLAVKKEMALSI